MQGRSSQFIDNIIALTDAEQRARTQELQCVIEENALILAYALIDQPLSEGEQRNSVALNQDNPLIKQITAVKVLQHYIQGGNLLDEAFDCLLDPAPHVIENKLKQAKRNAASHPQDHGVPHVASGPSLEEERARLLMETREEEQNLFSETAFSPLSAAAGLTAAFEEDSEEESEAESKETTTLIAPQKMSSSSKPSSILQRFRSPFGAVDHAGAHLTVHAIEAFLSIREEHRNVLHGVTYRLMGDERYQQAGQSQVKELRNFSQFLIFLMADALVQLHSLLQMPQHKDLRNNPEHQRHVSVITEAVKIHEETLPSAEPIAAMQSRETLEQFLGHLAITPRSLQPKEQSKAVMPAIRNSGDFTDGTPLASSPQRVVKPVSEKSAYPMPEYLAQSFKKDFADAIEEDVKRVEPVIVALTPQKRIEKSDAMKEGVIALRNSTGERPKSVRDIYVTPTKQDGDTTLQDVLTKKQNVEGNHARSYNNTLANAGLKFIAENPASLMRRYVFLTQLSDVATYADKSNEKIHDDHLKDIIIEMSALRKAMLTLYSSKPSPSAIVACMKELIELATQHPKVELLVRLLLVACLDKLGERAFANLSLTIKGWLIEANDYFDRKAFIKAVATDLERRSQGHIRALEKALLELTSFQQGQYKKPPYKALDHQSKIEKAFIHLGACVDNYFQPTSLPEKESIIDLQLIEVERRKNLTALAAESSVGEATGESKEADRQAEDVVSYVDGANKDEHKTRLRLITNLKPHWQAMLAANVNVGSITATTLALVNSGDKAALGDWSAALEIAAQSTFSTELQVNAWIVKAATGESRARDAAPYGKLEIDSIADKEDSARVAYYGAIIRFAEVLLTHVVNDQSKSNINNRFVNELCLAVCDFMGRAHDLIVSLESLLLQMHYISEESKKTLNELHGWILRLEHLRDVGVERAIPLLVLQEKIETFDSLFMAACFPIQRKDDKARTPIVNDKNETIAVDASKISESIKAIRLRAYGPEENIINPNAGPAFRYVFDKAIKLKRPDDMFFIKALFTLGHHPIIPLGYASQMCKEIGDRCATAMNPYPDSDSNRAEKWKTLEPKWRALGLNWAALSSCFNGNRESLHNLFNYYMDEHDVEKALKIATFGFSNKTFAAHKLEFARDMILAFSKFDQTVNNNIAEQATENGLSNALEVFASATVKISSAECEALKCLEPVAKKLKNQQAKKCYDILYLRAKKHEAVRKFLKDTYSQPRQAVSQSPAFSIDTVIDAAMNIGDSRQQVSVRHDVVADIGEFDAFVKKVTDLCFPVGYRYYENRTTEIGVEQRNRRQSAKLTSAGNRENLTKKCQQKIADLLKNNRLTAEELKAEMNKLRHEVLQGSLEGTVETLQMFAPHELGDLVERNYGSVVNEIVLDAFAKRMKGFYHKLNFSSMQPSSSSNNRLSASFSRAENQGAAEERAAIVVTDEMVLAAVEWFDHPESPVADSRDQVGNAPPRLRRALAEDISIMTQNELDDFMVKYRRCGSEDLFEVRVGFLRAKDNDNCLKHVYENVRSTTDFETFKQDNASITGQLFNQLTSSTTEGYRKLKIVSPGYPEINETSLDSVTLFVRIINENSATVYWQASNGSKQEKILVADQFNQVARLIEELLGVGPMAESQIKTIPALIERLTREEVLISTNPVLIDKVARVCACTHHHPRGELVVFIHELRQRAPEYLDDFIWSLAENGAHEEMAAQAREIIDAREAGRAPIQVLKNAMLNLLEIAHEYDWAALIFLGCKRYAAMNDNDRATKGPRLLQALVKFAQPLLGVVDAAHMARIENLKFALSLLDSSTDPSMHILNCLRGVKAQDKKTEKIYNFITEVDVNTQEHDAAQRARTFAEIKIRLTLQGKPSEVSQYAVLKLEKARCQYAAYQSIIALQHPDISNHGAKVYDNIYRLAQASRVLDEEGVDRFIKANALLDNLHGKLIDPTFEKWHREILSLSKTHLSSLHKLVRHQPLLVSGIERFYSKDLPSDLETIEEQPYYWKVAYQLHCVSEFRFACEAHAVYELEKLYRAKEFLGEKLQYKDKEGVLQSQHNSIMEQQALAFMAAKYWYAPEGDTKNKSPFKEAIRLMAQAHTQEARLEIEKRNCSSEEKESEVKQLLKQEYENIILNLLTKACDSFNLMLRSKDEKSYGLDTAKNVSLKREMKQWIKSQPEIARVYMERTLLENIHCEEQANFLLELIKLTNNYENKNALLFQVFEWKYFDINQQIPKSNGVALRPRIWPEYDVYVAPRLNVLLKQIEKYSLWQEYYAYIAYHQHPDRCVANLASFARYTDLASGPYRLPHAMKLWNALKENPCKNLADRTQVLTYILKSWCAAINYLGLKAFLEKADCLEEASHTEEKSFGMSVVFRCTKMFSPNLMGKLKAANQVENKMRDILMAEYREAVPSNIQTLLATLCKELNQSETLVSKLQPSVYGNNNVQGFFQAANLENGQAVAAEPEFGL